MGLNHLEAGFGHREGTIVTTFTDTSTPRLLGSRRPVDVFGSAWPRRVAYTFLSAASSNYASWECFPTHHNCRRPRVHDRVSTTVEVYAQGDPKTDPHQKDTPLNTMRVHDGLPMGCGSM